ncbi:hypothetical protein S1001342_03204 (plasmid) [Acetobacter pasteurianus subsp. pasteurianus]|uniref:Uncharacterized protein n=1 Tax=Acetobacter pasteurianus subsp. pasteurianus TaxID=481145 RepID=A0A1Y0YAT1_ACEPA|nr:hypothetical protein S1001342_03204 [Acetobacter pasteurianus subsp. pasteurianus]
MESIPDVPIDETAVTAPVTAPDINVLPNAPKPEPKPERPEKASSRRSPWVSIKPNGVRGIDGFTDAATNMRRH